MSKDLILHPTASNATAFQRQVQKYVEGLRDGLGRSAAARAAGTTLHAIRQSGREVQKYLSEARSEFAASPEELRELVLLQWTQRALTSTDPRVALLALNELSKVPEVGLKSPKGGSAAGPKELGTLSDETRAVLDGLEEER
jgi:hypothetical protein